jgi:hypothetical protein
MRYLMINLLAALAIISCKKEDKDESGTFTYEQTYCSDPWINSSNDSITVQNVYHYLDSMQVIAPAVHVWIKHEVVGLTCQACNCKTGKKIYVSLYFPKDVEGKLNSLGFNRIQ